MNPIYATLGYPRSSNIVKNRKVINSFITYYENDKVMNGDGLGSRFGRVLIEVASWEKYEMAKGVIINEVYVTLPIDNTEKGFLITVPPIVVNP